MKTISNLMGYADDVMAGRPPTKEAPLFGKRMATLRQNRGLSQTELAKRLNMSRAMVTYYERKAINPTAEVIQKIAEALDVDLNELLARNGSGNKERNKPGPASTLEQQIFKIKQLPRSKQKFVVDFLETFIQREAQAT